MAYFVSRCLLLSRSIFPSFELSASVTLSLQGLVLKHETSECEGIWTDSLERPSCWERLKTVGEGDDRR